MGNFPENCPKTSNLTGNICSCLTISSFRHPWKPTKSGRSESWWKTASVDPKRLARCSFHLCHRLRRRRFFFHGFFCSIWTLRCVSSRKSKCQTFGKMPNCPPRHCEKIARVQIELPFVNVFLYIIYMLNFHVVQLQYIDFSFNSILL